MVHANKGLLVVEVKYAGSRPVEAESDPTPAYAESGAYAAFGEPTVVEPRYREPDRYIEPAEALGRFGAEVASVVAAGRRDERPVLVVGGHCGVLPGVLGGLQQAHGPAARVGLVWFDAHGDFNTPRTSISGVLGGMAVAVAAGLALPEWRETAGMETPLPTDRILLVDARNLDPGERRLIEATAVTVAASAPGRPGADLDRAVRELAERVDTIYLHVDSDVLDHRYVPNHPTAEPRGPSVTQVADSIGRVMETGKVSVFALVSVWAHGQGGATTVESAIALLGAAMRAWSQAGIS